MNKTQLGEAVADDLGCSKEDGLLAVEAVLDAIARTVAGGETVRVTNFGTWLPVQRPERTARDPRNGDPITVPARQEMSFIQSDRLRELIRAADPETATIRKLPKGAVS